MKPVPANVAQLTGAATTPAHRRRGIQTALLSARLADAAAAGQLGGGPSSYATSGCAAFSEPPEFCLHDLADPASPPVPQDRRLFTGSAGPYLQGGHAHVTVMAHFMDGSSG